MGQATQQAQEAPEALLEEMRIQENSPEELLKLRCMTDRRLVLCAIEKSLRKVSRKITQAQSQEYELEPEKPEKLARSYKASLRADILPYALVYYMRKSSNQTNGDITGKMVAIASWTMAEPAQHLFKVGLPAGLSMLSSGMAKGHEPASVSEGCADVNCEAMGEAEPCEANVAPDESMQCPLSDQPEHHDDMEELLEETDEQELMALFMTIMANGVAGTMGSALGDDLATKYRVEENSHKRLAYMTAGSLGVRTLRQTVIDLMSTGKAESLGDPKSWGINLATSLLGSAVGMKVKNTTKDKSWAVSYDQLGVEHESLQHKLVVAFSNFFTQVAVEGAITVAAPALCVVL